MRIKDEQKLEAIIQATLELTRERGLAGVKMNALAKRAGIATGSLYTYFKDKQDLLLSVYHYVRERGAVYLRDSLDLNQDLADRIRTTVGHYADYVGRHREAIGFIDDLKRSPFITPEALAEVTEQYRFLQQLFIEGQAAGLIREDDPERLLLVIDGIIKAVIDFQFLRQRPYDREVRQACRELAWAAVKKPG
ncbi:MAG: TetR/AcrR family transcriptional regulator [Bacteroidota bacterium]